MKKLIVSIAVLGLLSISTFLSGQNENIVLKTDFEGKVVEGSIDKLITEIQNGKSVRVGWQLDFDNDKVADLEHWIDANFLSILNGHVFNQIEPIYKQLPKADIPQVEIIPSDMQWTAIIGTNGKLISRYVIPNMDQFEDDKLWEKLQEMTAIKERMVATIWVIE